MRQNYLVKMKVEINQNFPSLGEPWPKGSNVFITSQGRWFIVDQDNYNRESDEISENEANSIGIVKWFMSKHYIQDWAGNILSYDKLFKRPEFAVSLDFKSFDDAEEYLIELLGDNYEEDRGEYYIEEKVTTQGELDECDHNECDTTCDFKERA